MPSYCLGIDIFVTQNFSPLTKVRVVESGFPKALKQESSLLNEANKPTWVISPFAYTFGIGALRFVVVPRYTLFMTKLSFWSTRTVPEATISVPSAVVLASRNPDPGYRNLNWA